MTMRRILLLFLAATPITSLSAQVRPQPGPGDPRLQTIDYVADQVVLVEAALGYQVTIDLAPDEQVQSVAVGDSGSWQISADRAGNHLFLKPLRLPADTNMTVRTNVRLYAFDLAAVSSPSSNTPYLVRFRFPAIATLENGTELSGEEGIVGHYRLSGSVALRPAGISDDGERTTIEWPQNAALPAVYVVDSAGREAVANGYMRGEHYVIDSISPRLIFRLDKRSARATRYIPKRTPGG